MLAIFSILQNGFYSHPFYFRDLKKRENKTEIVTITLRENSIFGKTPGAKISALEYPMIFWGAK